MVLVDNRAGSVDLIAPLRTLGVEAEPTTLEFGDVCFSGRGPNDSFLNIGIEFKKLGEMVTSIRDGRFTGVQLPGLSPVVEHPTYDRAFLLIEGLWTHNKAGLVSQWSKFRQSYTPIPGRMSAAEYEKHLLTFELCGGISVMQTNTRADTLRWLVNTYHWFTDKAMDQHKGHLAPHHAATLIPLSPFRQAVSKWPGIGVRTSLAVERHFDGSIAAAASAGVANWASVTTVDKSGKPRRLGMATAEKLVNFLQGRG